MNFYVTFGMQYATEMHPRFEDAHPDGWVRIVAPTYNEARRLTVALFGTKWSFLYPEKDWEDFYFPKGELLCVVSPQVSKEL